MTPTLKILQGDALEKLKELPDESVQCCVTSPPYWGLRDYGVEGQIGLEPTFDEFLARLVAVFNEVRRVLRKDGVAWINMGDSYSSVPGKRKISDKIGEKQSSNQGSSRVASVGVDFLKPKDLIGQPWRLAFALQAEGWYLRSDIIWHKPNPMPESVDDRPTKAHEYIFLLTKSPKYFYDAEAIMESCSESTHARVSQNVAAQIGSARANAGGKTNGNMKAVVRGGVNPKAAANAEGSRQNESFSSAICLPVSKRNKRSVWTVPTASFSDAHFATFPPDLIRPCILAGTSGGGCCSKCGAPRKRIVELGEADREHQRACGGDKNGEYHGQSTKDYANGKAQDASATKARILAGMRARITTGWESTCKCENSSIVPCTVLDPFGGSGTTGQVANELGRNAILIELNPAYIPLINRRTAQPGLML